MRSAPTAPGSRYSIFSHGTLAALTSSGGPSQEMPGRRLGEDGGLGGTTDATTHACSTARQARRARASSPPPPRRSFQPAREGSGAAGVRPRRRSGASRCSRGRTDEAPPLEQPQRHLGIADVDGQKHRSLQQTPPATRGQGATRTAPPSRRGRPRARHRSHATPTLRKQSSTSGTTRMNMDGPSPGVITAAPTAMKKMACRQGPESARRDDPEPREQAEHERHLEGSPHAASLWRS